MTSYVDSSALLKRYVEEHDSDVAERLRAAGRDRAQRFSMDRLAEAYTVIYEAVIAEALLNA